MQLFQHRFIANTNDTALSMKCRWLIILAPHKKPEVRNVISLVSVLLTLTPQIKDGWGWSKWDVENWTEVPMTEIKGEILNTR